MNGNDATAFNLTQHTPKTVIKIAILGAESTGKTTLCRDLATHFSSPWVPEYMRIYLQEKWDNEQMTCTWDDLLPIAQGQIKLENKLAQQAAQDFLSRLDIDTVTDTQKYLFCDTSLFELMVYSNWYYGDCPLALKQAALAHHYDLILLTDVDIPWVADDLRDSPYEREEISAYFESQLNKYNKRFRRIGGNRDERVRQVINYLRYL
ncbi:AAA family ATPase [Psychrobacter sp. 1U1]|uniref:AAA family ATPase n=2 Tax=unclassified Psychrobacter TaxID=196806 RepID=UPI003F47615F